MGKERKFMKRLAKPRAPPDILNEGNEITDRRMLADFKRYSLYHEETYGRPPDASLLDLMKTAARVMDIIREPAAGSARRRSWKISAGKPERPENPGADFLNAFNDGVIRFILLLESEDIGKKEGVSQAKELMDGLVALCKANNLDPDLQLSASLMELIYEFAVNGKRSYSLMDGKKVNFSLERMVDVNELLHTAEMYSEFMGLSLPNSIIWCLEMVADE